MLITRLGERQTAEFCAQEIGCLVCSESCTAVWFDIGEEL
jgi:hypothetical protein